MNDKESVSELNDDHDSIPPDEDLLSRVRIGLICTVILVVLADWLFFNHPLGWAAGAFGLLLIGTLAVRAERMFFRKPAWLVMWLTAALFLGCVEEPNGLSLWLGALGVVTLSLTLREGWVGNAVVWMMRWIFYAFEGWLCLPVGANVLRSGFRDHGKREKGPSFLRRWLVAVGLGGLFVVLFAFANPVIESWLDSLGTALAKLFNRLPDFFRIIFWVVAGFQIFALLCYRTCITEARLNFIEDKLAGAPGGFFSPAAILRALLAFNLLFGVQTVLDLFYLWGGVTLPDGMTCAEYAHRGAYPLIATVLLAAGFVLLIFQPGQSPESVRWSRRLVYLWLLQNVFLIISAGWRLLLYVDAYSLTRLRVAAAIWMVLIACGLLWIIIRIATGRSNLWLINVNAVTAVVMLFFCSFVNMDGLIASFNVRHSEEVLGAGHPSIDVEYLAELGYDTLPALIWLKDRASEPLNNELDWYLPLLTAQLEEDLSDWRGWTWRRARIQEAVRRAGIKPPAELENINQVADLKEGDDVVADCYEAAGQHVISTPVKEEKDAEMPLEVPPPAPVIAPAVVVPVILSSTGTVVSLTPGNLRIKQTTDGSENDSCVDYSIAKNAELHGIRTLADLKLNQKVSVESVESEGRRYITALTTQ